MLLHLVEERAAGAVGDALRLPGRARGVHDEERVVERHVGVVDRARRIGGREVRQRHRPLDAGDVRRLRQERHHHHALDGRQLGQDLRQPVEGAVALAVVEVAVGGEEHLGLDLAEAVQHALHAEVGRAARPHRADGRRRQHGDHRLRHVGQEAGHPVAGLDPGVAQRLGGDGDGVVKLAPAHAARGLVLRPEDDGVGVVAPAQQVLGVVQPGVGEEGGAGHLVGVDQHALAPGLGLDVGEVPDGQPEGLHRVDGPLPEIAVALQREPVTLVHHMAEAGQVRGLDAVRRRGPKRRAHGGAVLPRLVCPCRP